MANTKSAKKMIHVIERRTIRNRMIKNRVKTIKKKCERDISICLDNYSAENQGKAVDSFRIAQKEIHKSVTKGIMHKNKAARLVSRMNKRLKDAVLQTNKVAS
ncbi:30S ribosomal protein S20 [Anaplasmataceae bacterium AB001_6]|nr:30S ribosomal protein S20 [Anaplasmataceae bacterium AB001_6]